MILRSMFMEIVLKMKILDTHLVVKPVTKYNYRCLRVCEYHGV